MKEKDEKARLGPDQVGTFQLAKGPTSSYGAAKQKIND